MSKISYDRCAADADKYLKVPHEGFLSVSTRIKSEADQEVFDSALDAFIKNLKK